MIPTRKNTLRKGFDRGLPKTARIFVAGHRGLVGSAVLRVLAGAGYRNLAVKTRRQLDLTDQRAVDAFFEKDAVDAVFLAAALVGGIHANNTYPADFIYQNLIVECNVINSAFRHGAGRLLFLGSSCIYPRDAVQPMREEQLLGGYLESTNEPYAVAKIAGIKLCEAYNRQHGTDFRAVMPTNLYGPNDNFDLNDSHVLPALIRRFHLAKLARAGAWADIEKDAEIFGPVPGPESENLRTHRGGRVRLWGTGNARREFLHVDDLAAACLQVMQLSAPRYRDLLSGRSHRDSEAPDDERPGTGGASQVNVGFGKDIPISELADLVSDAVGYEGAIEWDHSRPDGTMRKLLDISRIRSIGWQPAIGLAAGIRQTYRWYLKRSQLD